MQLARHRAKATGLQQRPVHWWGWVLVAGGLIAAVPSWGQGGVPQSPGGVVPEAVRPRSSSPTIPQGNDGSVMPVPKSDDTQVNGGRPVPDRGVIVPPISGMGTTPVIRPPAAGGMPVIPPPGSAGGDKGVVPK